MNYRTIAGEQGVFACQNNLHMQMGQQGIQFGQLQSVTMDWGDGTTIMSTWDWGNRPSPGSANMSTWDWGNRPSPGSTNMGDGSVMKVLVGLIRQLRPYMSPVGKIDIPGLNSGNAAIDFCRAAAIPTSMLQLNGDGRGRAGWSGPITRGILIGL